MKEDVSEHGLDCTIKVIRLMPRLVLAFLKKLVAFFVFCINGCKTSRIIRLKPSVK